jgi:hypothetical protein
MGRCILIEVPYGHALVLPSKCAAYLPGAVMVKTGEDRQLHRTSRTVEVNFIDWHAIQPPTEPSPPPPSPVASC